jgi:hypothetical protein
LFTALRRREEMDDKIRVTLIREFIKKNIKLESGSGGWALPNEPVYKKKKQQKYMVNVVFDDGQECAVPWHLLMRRLDDEKEEVVIRYARKT